MSQLTDLHVEWFTRTFDALSTNVQHVVKGKPEVVELALICLFAEGHLLLEDIPGTGKTVLARSVAASIAGQFKRIQFTPDLLPSDITGGLRPVGTNGEILFYQGPIFANLVVADEINRASPKTQAALLEVMEERQHSIEGHTYPLPRPFVVIATQNPIEQHGTYPLPEAQLDRFLIRTSIGLLDHDSELEVLSQNGEGGLRPEDLNTVVDAGQVMDLITVAKSVYAAPQVLSYVIRMAQETRDAPELSIGVSTRGCVALVAAARVRAIAHGRGHVIPDDVKALAASVFSHRMVLDPQQEFRGADIGAVLERSLSVAPPKERVNAG